MTESKQIKYKSGYKYQLTRKALFATGITGFRGGNEWIQISTDGVVAIRSGYAWDGPSGPTFDTKSTMRASLLHDALYQLIIEGVVSVDQRLSADDELYRVLIEDGCWRIRAKAWLLAVNHFGDDYMGSGSGSSGHTAP